MFIKPSQRQNTSAKATGDATSLSLHRHLARGRARRSRLFLCAAAALGVSLVAWLLDLYLALHVALVGAGFLAGFAWPLERTEPWALAWIDVQTGLAYRTALERQTGQPHGEDRYGFLQALNAQAERNTKRLELPTAQPWWLPLLAVALSLAVLPALSFPGGLGGGSGAGSNAPLTPNEGAPPAAQSEADDDPESEVSEAEPSAGEDSAQNPELERTFDAPGEDTSGDGLENSAEGGDSETLERYLESLEEQDAAQPGASESETQPETQGSGAERNPFSRGEQPNQSDQSQGSQSAEQGAEQNQQGGSQQEGAQQGEQGDQRGQDTQSQGESQDGSQDASQDGPQDGQGEGNSPEQTQPPEEGERQAGGSEGTPSEQEQQAEGQEPQQAQGESEGSQEGQGEEGAGQSGQSEGEPTQGESAQGGSAGSQEGEQEGGGAEGDETNGSGSLPSEASPSSAERLASPQTRPDLLEGQRGEGRVSSAGETLAPGSDDVNIPNAQTDAEYERAAEEAINEGRIPVEYQDILRNYFR